LVNQLPFNCNLDFTDSIKLNKGCYLGQELCARTYYTGVIRKRLMTVIISDSKDKLEKLIAQKDNTVPASALDEKLVRLDFVDDKFLEGMPSQEKSDLFHHKTIKNSQNRKAFKILSVENNVGIAIADYFTNPESFQEEIYTDGQFFYK